MNELKAYKGDIYIPVYGSVADAKVYLKSEADKVIAELGERRNQQEVQVMCKYCDFDETCGKQVGEPFPEGFGVTAAIQQDRTFYSIVNTDGLDGIIYGINYCPMCGRKLEDEEVEQKIKEFINGKEDYDDCERH